MLSFAPGAPEDTITDVAIDAGADDVVVNADDGSIEVLTAPESYPGRARRDGKSEREARRVRNHDARRKRHCARAARRRRSVAKLLDWLEDLDDVQNVYSNADLPAEAYA